VIVPATGPERDAEIWRRYSRGERQHQIAKSLGVSQQQISEAVNRHRLTIPAETREQLVQTELDYHWNLRAEIDAIRQLKPGPVVAGKDGRPVHDPETGEVVWDYTAHLTAARTALQVSQHIARLGGLEAPTRIDVTATEEAAARALGEKAAEYVQRGESDA
jgi:transcriptional regulator with XRE-family HTH domain